MIKLNDAYYCVWTGVMVVPVRFDVRADVVSRQNYDVIYSMCENREICHRVDIFEKCHTYGIASDNGAAGKNEISVTCVVCGNDLGKRRGAKTCSAKCRKKLSRM